MSVTRGGKGTQVENTGFGTTLSQTFTVGSESNRALVVQIAWDNNGAPGTVNVTWDYGGTAQACTLIQYQKNGTGRAASLYGLVAPTSGTNLTLRLECGGSTFGAIMNVAYYYNVKQDGGATTFANAVSNTGSSSTASVTITSATGDMTIDCFGAPSGSGTPTQTLLWFLSGSGAEDGGASEAAGSASNTHQWSIDNVAWAIVGCNIVQVGNIYTGAVDESTSVADSSSSEKLQNALPSSDISDGGWTDDSSGTNLSGAIGEWPANDSSYIRSGDNPSNDECEVKLATKTDPGVSTGHVIRWRYYKVGSATIDLTVTLAQGTTVIKSQTYSDIAGSLVEGALTLSGTEADSITDYSDLRLRFKASVPAAAVYSDNFNRADGGLGSNFSPVYWDGVSQTIPLGIVSQRVTVVSWPYQGAEIWSANTFANDQYSKIVPVGSSGRYAYAGVRMITAHFYGYFAKTNNTDSWLVRIDGDPNSQTVLATYTGTGFNGTTDVMEIRAIGSAISFWKNGTQVGTDVTDSTYASGSAGIYVAPDNNTFLDDWEGGDL